MTTFLSRGIRHAPSGTGSSGSSSSVCAVLWLLLLVAYDVSANISNKPHFAFRSSAHRGCCGCSSSASRSSPVASDEPIDDEVTSCDGGEPLSNGERGLRALVRLLLKLKRANDVRCGEPLLLVLDNGVGRLGENAEEDPIPSPPPAVAEVGQLSGGDFTAGEEG